MSDLIRTFHLRNLPPYAKTFVGIFTALMLCVSVWAVWIYTARYGKVDVQNLPAYLGTNDLKADIEELKSGTSAVMAPVWDTMQAGKEQPIDSATIEAIKRQPIPKFGVERNAADQDEDLGLAHTHINGQTLLFFAIGLIFLFSSATPKSKKIVYWIFGLSILGHNLGLSFRSCSGMFGDLLAISGVLILLSIAYMAFVIFTDLAQKPASDQ
jgi:hypothetical protein